MTDLRTAAQAALDKLIQCRRYENLINGHDADSCPFIEEEALRQALAEPVAWRWDRKSDLHEFGYEPYKDFCPKNATSITPLYTTPPSIDALIAEIDELPTIYSDTAPSRPSYFKSDVQATLNKYRSKK